MLLAQGITVTTEAMTIIGVVVGALVAAITFLFRGWIAALQADRDSWKHMAEEGVEDLEKVAKRERARNGHGPVKKAIPVAAVVPEASSPPTKQQKETAEVQTMRARLVAAKLDLGLPKRTIKGDKTDEKWTEP